MKHTTEQLKDIVITACEGGVNYWGKVRFYDPDNGKAVLVEYGDEDTPIATHTINTSTIRKGLRLALESEHENIRFIAVRDILDADEADIIVQLGLFGELVYG